MALSGGSAAVLEFYGELKIIVNLKKLEYDRRNFFQVFIIADYE